MSKLLGSQESAHPDHASDIPRLRRMIGQLEAVERMISERRYCPDIIQQLRAANSAGKALENEILKRHLASCIKSAARTGSQKVFNEKIDELMDLIRS